MKRMISLLIAFSFLFSLSACSGQKKSGEKTTSDSESKSTLRFALGTPITKEEKLTGDGGVVLLALKYELPTLELHKEDGSACDLEKDIKTSADKQKAEVCNTFNAEMKSVAEKLDSTAKVKAEAANKAYKNLDASARESWTNYAEELTIANTYITDSILSVLGDGYSNNGAAYPTSYSRTWNFDLTSGEFIKFDTLAGDENPLGSTLTDALSEVVFNKINENGSDKYNNNFASLVVDLSKNASFYFDKDGIVIKFDPDVIAPRAAGAQIFNVSYEKFYYALSEQMQSLVNISENDGIISDYYATQAIWKWFNMITPAHDSNAEKVTVKGVDYYKVTLGNIKTMSELNAFICKHVSEKIAKEWLDTGKFIESDGELYVSDGGRGEDITIGATDYSIKLDGESGTLTQTVSRQGYDSSKKTYVATGKTDEYVYPFTLKDGHAIFSDFPCPL